MAISHGPISHAPISGIGPTIAPGGAPPEIVPQRTRIAAQQDVRGWQEVAGYALLFTSALMPNANTVGAAEYTVGTHQAAIAQSQDRSWVRGTPFTLIPSAAGDVILRPTKVAAPQQVDGAYALTFSAPLSYLAVVVPPPSTLHAAPEQVDGAYARLTAPPLSYLARVTATATTLHAGEQVDPSPFHPPSWVHGTTPDLFPVTTGDTLPPQTWIAAPEQIDGAYALTFRIPLTYVAVVTAAPVTITVEPQVFDAAYALTFKPAPQYLANVRPVAETRVTLAEPFDTYIAAHTFGTPPASVGPGTDVRIGSTIQAYQQHDPDRPSFVVLIPEALIPAPVVPVVPPGGGGAWWYWHSGEWPEDETPDAEEIERVADEAVRELQKARERTEKARRKPLAAAIVQAIEPEVDVSGALNALRLAAAGLSRLELERAAALAEAEAALIAAEIARKRRNAALLLLLHEAI